MAAVLTLPRYVAGADLAEKMIAALDPDAIADGDVEIDARAVASASSSFARGCVQFLLVRGHASRILLTGGPDHFREYLAEAVRAEGIQSGRVVVQAGKGLLHAV